MDLNLLLWSSTLIFSMHLGITFLILSVIRPNFYEDAILMLLLDLAVSAIAWWMVGYAFAFGDSNNSFIGTTGFFEYSSDWYFQYAVAATTASLSACSIVERLSLHKYLIFVFWFTMWIYAIPAFWVWNPKGWLSMRPDGFLGVGAIDYSGDGPVHVLGGLFGSILCYRVGVRSDTSIQLDATKLYFGTMILWIAWFGFNCGSALYFEYPDVDRVWINTLLSSSSSALVSYLFAYYKNESRLAYTTNGLLAGLVMIGSSCIFVELWAALVIGIIAGFIYCCGSVLLHKLEHHFDDPLEVSVVHFLCGSVGLIVTGFFVNPDLVEEIDPNFTNRMDYAGLFYNGNGHLLAAQLTELFALFGWCVVMTIPCYIIT